MKNSKLSKNQNPNRDAITGEPGSHPIGTGAGAAAGGAAGAAVGMAAGPIGAGVGAAVGAVAGGMAGKASGEHFNPTEGGDLGRFLDYSVLDSKGDKVGTVDAVWEDSSGQPSYLALRTGWLGLGKAHVVPADGAEVSETQRKIRLPYTEEQIKSAPQFDSQDDITTETEYTISDHFGAHRSEDDGTRPLSRPPQDDEVRVQLKKEELKVGKRDVSNGGVRLRKIIRTETVMQPVELEREEIVIERVPVQDGASSPQAEDFNEKEIFVPLRREEAVVQKTARAREEVRVGKRTVTDKEKISDTIRSEDVEIENENPVSPSSKDRADE